MHSDLRKCGCFSYLAWLMPEALQSENVAIETKRETTTHL